MNLYVFAVAAALLLPVGAFAAFARSMITDHTAVNKSATDLVLVKVRPAFVAHLDHAKRLQASMTENATSQVVGPQARWRRLSCSR